MYAVIQTQAVHFATGLSAVLRCEVETNNFLSFNWQVKKSNWIFNDKILKFSK